MAGVMTELPSHGYQHRRGDSLQRAVMAHGGPKIEMMPNADFSFPMRPDTPPDAPPADATAARPASVQAPAAPALHMPLAHRRAASTLPSFSFNAADASGRREEWATPLSSDDAASTAPKRGHRRGGSEFVGGDSRLGVAGAINSSPTRTEALPLPIPSAGPPAGRRGHAHRRSAAMSSHDVTDLMKPPTETAPRLSSSLPEPPVAHPSPPSPPRPVDTPSAVPDVTPEPEPIDLSAPSEPDAEADADRDEARPPSRPRVGFADNVEYIPRPLSTISSETESSLSTVRGHSVNNSISSVLSMSASSPPSARSPRRSLGPTYEDETRPRVRSSLEISKRVEKEGEWLRSSTSSSSMPRPLSEPGAASSSLSFAVPDSPVKARNAHGKKQSISHALGFSRRRSEPAISMQPEPLARLSALSLQEETESDRTDAVPAIERRSSTKRIKNWAMSRMSKKGRESKRAAVADESELEDERPPPQGDGAVPGKVPISALSVAETNLDTVFGGQAHADEPQPLGTPSAPCVDVQTPTPSYTGSAGSWETDDANAMLDLDAALGPFQTPVLSGHKPRREMHSSRLNKDFGGPGLHYHRRTESAPELPPAGFSRGAPASQSSLPDVFEGDGEEEAEAAHARRHPGPRPGHDEETGVGIEVVDADTANADAPLKFDGSLGIQLGEWEPERPPTSYGSVSSALSTPAIERRASSLIEETIPEEMSPIESVQIVEAHEEPRASSLTKSSDSSETPTLLASQTGNLPLSQDTQSLVTPDASQPSTFSSPDLARRQCSFDTSRQGTSTSSITDNRTVSSSAGDVIRGSVDDVPSLTSSSSTMMSTMQANMARRDVGGGDRVLSDASGPLDRAAAAERRRKRASIQSLSQLVGGSFSGKSKVTDESRPQTANDSLMGPMPRKEPKLKKLMFWRSKSRQSLRPDP